MAISKLDGFTTVFPTTTAAPTPSIPTMSGNLSAVADIPLAAPRTGETGLQAQTGGQPQAGQQPQQREITREETQALTEALNHFMALQNADLQFSYHEKTSRLIVKLVDTKNNEVLREFPPKEFLDMVARIQEYLGALVDKKV